MIFSLIVFILILLVLVFVHELGHFVFAKLFNVYCVNFSLGMGPEIVSKKGKETTYSLRALPIGGYVQMVGEEDIELEGVPKERTILGIKNWQKLIIFVAGAMMNFLLAFMIFTYISAVSPVAVSDNAYVSLVAENSAAQQAGLQVGDQFLSMKINGTVYDVSTMNDLLTVNSLYEKAQNTYEITVLRDGKEINVTITSTFNEQENRYMLGYSPTYEYKNVPFGIQTFVNGAKLTVSESTAIFKNVVKLFTGELSVKQLSGPVGIYKATDSIVATQNINGLLTFMAILSVNFGVINLLPIPALDGGRIIIVLAEMITRRKLNQKIEDRIHLVGFLLLMGLIVFIMINDILKIVG